MLVRFNPVTTIFDEIDSLIHSTADQLPTINTLQRTGRFGAVSMKESDDKVQVQIELPGVIKKDVSVTVNNGVLTIATERVQPELKDQEQWIRNEIVYGKFERSLQMPYSIDVEHVSATQENGILSIVLPKHENAKLKQISIR